MRKLRVVARFIARAAGRVLSVHGKEIEATTEFELDAGRDEEQ